MTLCFRVRCSRSLRARLAEAEYRVAEKSLRLLESDKSDTKQKLATTLEALREERQLRRVKETEVDELKMKYELGLDILQRRDRIVKDKPRTATHGSLEL